ncbi:hypothetical protein EDD91_7852 [Streptomyces sp. KS 21]|nr:hypothetical protein EDD91_7852 [Streptomyces sp. KS 21]
MENFPEDVKYTKDHEWIRMTGKVTPNTAEPG